MGGKNAGCVELVEAELVARIKWKRNGMQRRHVHYKDIPSTFALPIQECKCGLITTFILTVKTGVHRYLTNHLASVLKLLT